MHLHRKEVVHLRRNRRCTHSRKSTRYPELSGRLERGALPDLGKPFGGQFDGVLCSAVLMHLPRHEIPDAACAIRNVLRPNGRLLLFVPAERAGLNGEHRDEHGRLFTPLPSDYIRSVFERLRFELVDEWYSQDAMRREGYSWYTARFDLRPATPRGLTIDDRAGWWKPRYRVDEQEAREGQLQALGHWLGCVGVQLSR